MKILYFLFTILLIPNLNCINYDLHPELSKGTSFYIRNPIPDSFKNSRVFYSATKFNGGIVQKSDKIRIDEYYFLSFYTGRAIGTFKNGSLVDLLEKEIKNIQIREDEYFLFEINNIKYESNAYYDLLNDFIPGGFIRYNYYQLYYTLKILTKEQFNNLASNK